MVDESKVKEAVKLLLEGIGEDPEREGLKDTPDRIARMYTELMAGYDDKPSNHLSRTFRAENNEMVLEKDIVFYSMCEHHMMPFFGKAHIAYIPNGKVVGLSKLARCVETYARRLQIQEKMTAQIADAIMDELQPQGVMIVVEAEHLCMTARGVKKPGSKTTTVVTRGVFADNEKLQTLFFRLLNERIEGLPDENR
ncbi:MAG: GTP cyclohydrolase I FolE [Lachnospiraceae bacterium]|nr:GTP cyclohydrolase I FolE [Lachnospiraceae bacterium]